MTILLTGADGYMGWPTLLKLAKEFPNERIVGVDNFGRRRWVEEIGSVSAVPIASMEDRVKAAHEKGLTNISFIYGDLVDRDFVLELVSVFKPRAIVHLAAQPSAPYSEINGERANYTQHNNTQSTRNLLWALKELNALDTLFIETTTTGVYGQPGFPIPEGYVEVERKGQRDTIIFPGMAGSWYHMSKCHDVNNLWLANSKWKLPIIDLRTAIVYGTSTPETQEDPRFATRFDFDFYFGTVVNRFVAQALAGFPITVYGKGDLKRPMIGLQDAVNSTVAAVKRGTDGKFEIFNQTSGPVSIQEVANAIQKIAGEMGVEVEVEHLPNPRVEKEEHQMVMENDRFIQELLPDIHVDIEAGIRDTLESLLPYKDVLSAYKDRFIPEQLLAKVAAR
ncbi:NAD-dependent epimerase/dehydratase [Thermobaculum terrenum ATCC BAA-798]|uniref:NAD-dependent epimerase/dehydratase n=1 Tax=Thermobaculum terrenum (strain ATCC BAA-798 / CCMEE 7001 / YNP1) TaxID=525904 RepID=D1CD90_THET1|nr:NAD-dependent epimerase/dehydratase family protein [Thermobaculum terrenum]ACZ42755.1 NAD-dependent epimerase/dehydratase [Thermobaculum terrenum ATCC BAA-798]